MTQYMEMGCRYLQRAFGTSKSLVDPFREATRGVKFDTIVGTGLSGALVVPTLARATRKRFAIVRKQQHVESRHSWSDIEGHIGNRWLFVDDLVDSGATLRRVVDVVSRKVGSMYVGRYEYDPMHSCGDPCFTSCDEDLDLLG